MPRYANVDKLMEHAIRLDWSVLKWVNEVDISTTINPNVVEVKHGRWMFSPDDSEGICTVCQYKIYGRPYNNTYLIVPYNYCPNCGAKMSDNE